MRLSLDDTRSSIFDNFQQSHSEPLEKMSKSRGNSVSVDMVVYGVAELSNGHEFRDIDNRVITTWKRCGIWRNKQGDGFFYMGTAFQTSPVFLCKKEEIIPSRLMIRGQEVMQHPQLVDFWNTLYTTFPDEFE